MRTLSADLPLQKALGDRIVGAVAGAGFSAPVTTRQEQGVAWPYVLIGESTEDGSARTKSEAETEVLTPVRIYSHSIAGAKAIRAAIVAAVTDEKDQIELEPPFVVALTTYASSPVITIHTEMGSHYQAAAAFRFHIAQQHEV